MSAAPELLRLAREAHADGRDLDARLLLAAGITALAGDRLRPIVVGGTAVDVYAATPTSRGLRPSRELSASQDVDLVTLGEFGPDATSLRRILQQSAEFVADQPAIPEASRRRWWLKGAPMLVEVLGGELFGSADRLVELEVEGAAVYLWAPEDCAWQYAQSSLATHHRESWERAVVIARTQSRQAWDWDYLTTRAGPGAPAELVEALRAGDSFDAMLERVDEADLLRRASRRKGRTGAGQIRP